MKMEGHILEIGASYPQHRTSPRPDQHCDNAPVHNSGRTNRLACRRETSPRFLDCEISPSDDELP